MAVLEIKELPGKESRIDAAFFFGSSAGTEDADRELVTEVKAGRVRRGRAGRRRADAPKCKSAIQWHISDDVCDQLRTYGASCQA